MLKLNEFSNFSQSLNASVRISFSKLQVIGNFAFRSFILFLRFPTQRQSAKKRCLRFAILSCSEKLQNVFERVLKCEVFVQKSLSEKKYFEIKKSQTPSCCLHVNLATVKILGKSDKFHLSFSSLKCPLHVKKLIRENSDKTVNQTGNFYFRPKLKTAISSPIFNVFG